MILSSDLSLWGILVEADGPLCWSDRAVVGEILCLSDQSDRALTKINTVKIPPRAPTVAKTTQLRATSALERLEDDFHVDTNSFKTDFSRDRMENDTGPMSPTSVRLQTQTVVDSFDPSDNSQWISRLRWPGEALTLDSQDLTTDRMGQRRRTVPEKEPLHDKIRESPKGHRNSRFVTWFMTQSSSKKAASDSDSVNDEAAGVMDGPALSLFCKVTWSLQSTPLVEHGLPSNDTINGRDNWEEFVLEFFGAVGVWTSVTVSWTGKRIPDESSIDWWVMEARDSKAVPGIDKRCDEVGEEREKEDDRRCELTLVTGYWSAVMSEVMKPLCLINSGTRSVSLSRSESDSPEIQISKTRSIPHSLRSSVDRPTSRDVAKIWMTNDDIVRFDSVLKLQESDAIEERDLIQDFTLVRSAFSLTIRSPMLSISKTRKSIAFKNSTLGVEQESPMWLSSQSQTDTHSTSNKPQPAKVTFGSYLETNRHLPWPEQEWGHDWAIGRQTLDWTLHSWKSSSAQSTSISQGRGLEFDLSERVRRRVAETKRQRVFEAPARPTDPDRHSPHVPSTDEQSSRFNDPQSGEPEQFTRFKTVAVDDKTFFRSSALLLNFEPLIPFNRKTLRSSTDIFVASTDTPPVDW
jgi:hypothetical protein